VRLYLAQDVRKMSRFYLEHLKSSKSLETPYAAVRAGFVALALEKNRRATPFVAMARALKAAASKAATPNELLRITEIQPARGDTLGSSMRNVGGFMAQKKLTRSLLAHLKLAGKSCRWLHAEKRAWSVLPNDDTDVELQLRGLSWVSESGHRTLIYNLTVPVVRNNVDLCLFGCNASQISPSIYRTPTAYIALGELKGGIDPAGADEHWKTARSALNRINSAFEKKRHKPHTFFIGAAIEARMASEIWSLLKSGALENAANLTDENQIASITRWLCTL
jgi:hypothetical protein